MPKLATGLPKDPTVSEEPRFAVIEPPKPPQIREKTYFAQVTGTFDKVKLTAGKLIKLIPSDAQALLESRRIIPLSIALNLGIYPTKKESLGDKLKKAVVQITTGEETVKETPSDKPAPKSFSKSFLSNKLRDAIQAKKAQAQTSAVESDPNKKEAKVSAGTPASSKSTGPDQPKLSADKLAAIKAGGKDRK